MILLGYHAVVGWLFDPRRLLAHFLPRQLPSDHRVLRDRRVPRSTHLSQQHSTPVSRRRLTDRRCLLLPLLVVETIADRESDCCLRGNSNCARNPTGDCRTRSGRLRPTIDGSIWSRIFPKKTLEKQILSPRIISNLFYFILFWMFRLLLGLLFAYGA